MENTKVRGEQLASKSCKPLVNSVLLLAKPYVAMLCECVTIDRVPAQVVSGGSAGLIKTRTIKPRETSDLAASRTLSFVKKA